MSDSSYLIEIIARLRDETGASIDNLKRKIDDLKAQAAASDLGQGVGNLADEADRAAQSHDDLAKSQQAHGQATRQSRADIENQAAAFEKGTEQVQGHTAATSDAAAAQRELQAEAPKTRAEIENTAAAHTKGAEAAASHAESLTDTRKGMEDVGEAADKLGEEQLTLADRNKRAQNTFEDLTKSFERGSGDLRQLRQDLQASSQELTGLANAYTRLNGVADETGRSLRKLSEDAGAMSKSVSTLQSSSRQPIFNSLGIDKATQDLRGLSQEFDRFQRQSAAMEDQELMRLQSRAYASRFGSIARQLPGESAEAVNAFRGQLAARSLATPAPATKEVRDAISDATQKGDQLVSRMSTLDQAARSRTATNKELETGYRQVASGLRSVIGVLPVAGEEFRRFGAAMEDATDKAKNVDLARSGSGFTKFAQDVAHSTDQMGIKIISLSAALRGLRLVALAGFLQPLATGLVSLAGGFFSVASGAAQAAATIGGVFVSGLGQLIPMVSIGIASLIRLRDIFQAVSAAQAARQEAYYQPGQGLITQLQNTNQLIQAQQGLKNSYFGLQSAQVQVRESQIALTQSRIDAIRNLQDLVIAEQSAKLALSQSNLAVIQAQQELQKAQASGSQMAIQQAQLALRSAQISQEQARQGVPRSQQNLALAQRYGVAGSPGVLAATEGARQAQLAVVQQTQAIAAAERQLRITQLTLAQPASHMTSQQATLQYLLGQMSPIEKTLFGELNRLEIELRSPNSPLKRLTDAFIQPFVYAGQRLQQVLGDPKFMEPITKLADAMGKEGDSIFKTMFGPRGTSFFVTMAKDATTSIPIITKAITGLMGVFQDIAKAAAPAFDRLSGDWARFWDAMNRRDSSAAGQRRLTEFFNQGAKWAEDFAHLASSIFDLFKALGHDAAPQGMKTVTSFSATIRDATDWVKSHGAEVTNFFSQAREGLSLVGGILLQIGKTLVQVFSLSSLQAFSSFITSIVLPALKDFITIVGFIVRQITNVVNALGPLRVLLEAVFAGAFLLMGVGRLVSAFTKVTNVINGMRDAVIAFQGASGLGRVGAAWDALTTRITKGKTAIKETIAAQEELAGVTEATATKQVAAEATVDAAIVEQTALVTAEEADLATLTAGGTVAAGAGGIGIAGATAAGGGSGLLSRILGGAGSAGLAFALAGGPETLAGYLLNQTAPNGPPTGKAFTPQQILTGTAPQNRYPFTYGAANLLAGTPTSQITPTAFGSGTGSGPGIAEYLKAFLPDANQVNVMTSSAGALKSLYDRAQALLQLPNITAPMRRNLATLIDHVNPADVAIQKMGATWSATFAGINATTGNVLQQVQQVLKTDISNINANLGTGTTQGWLALTASANTAYTTVKNNTNLSATAIAAGLHKINDALNKSLKAMNEPPIDFFGVSNSPGAGGASLATLKAQGRAVGGWNPATPGGMVYRAGEAGHDEVTLTTDPRYASRQRALLGAYLRRAPHLASGGAVGGSYAFPFPKGEAFSWNRIDQGQDIQGPPGGPVIAIGPGLVSVGSDVFSGFGPHYPIEQLSSGPWAGRGIYYGHAWDTKTGPVRTGDIIGRTQSMANQWTAAPAGWLELGFTSALGQGIHGQGAAVAPMLHALATGHMVSGIGSAAAAVQSIVAPHLRGVYGAMGVIAQGAVNQATKAANAFLGTKGGGTGVGATGSGIYAFGATPAGGYSPTTFAQALLRAVGITPAAQNTRDILAWEQQEGGNWNNTARYNPLNTTLAMPGAGNTGTQGNIKVYVSWPQGVEATAETLKGYPTILSTLRSNAPLSAFEAAVNASPWGTHFAAGGLIARHIRRIGIRHLRKKVMRFAEGGRAPWGGAPVPIIAHEDERIVNPPQWNELGRLTGMGAGGLDSHLGYNTGSPRQHFQGGGNVGRDFHPGNGSAPGSPITLPYYNPSGVGTQTTPMTPGQIPTIGRPVPVAVVSVPVSTPSRPTYTAPASSSGGDGGAGASMTSAQRASFGAQHGFTGATGQGTPLSFTAINALLGGLTPGLITGSLMTSMQGLSKIFNAIIDALTIIHGLKLPEAMKKLSALVLNFADPNNPASALNLLQATFQLFSQNLVTQATRMAYSVSNVNPASIARQTFSSRRVPGATITGTQPTGFATGFGGVSLAGPQLTAANIGQTGQAMLDALTTRGSVEMTQYLQKEAEANQKIIDTVKARMSRAQVQPASTARTALIAKLQNSLTVLETQQSNLHSTIASQITTTYQNEQTYVQDALNQVADIYQTQQAKFQAMQSAAQALGQFSQLPSIDAALAASAQAQIGALGPLLEQAQKMHNADLVAQIQQQIEQLRATVAQSTAQMIQDAISGVQQTAQTQQARVSMLQTIAQTMTSAASTPGQFAAAGALNLQALNLNQSSLQGQLSQYNTLLGQATASGNTGAVATLTQTIDSLTGQLAQNYQAIEDNTAQVISQTSQYIQARGQFQTSTLGGLAQIITTIGQTTGYTNVATLKQLAGASNVSLQGTQGGLLQTLAGLGGGATGLASLLGSAQTPQAFVAALAGANIPGIESGQNQTWITTFENLISNLETNSQAIATNNQQLATLNGQLLQPQSWSTTAWSAFRNAIFSGMGNLLPQFQGVLPAGSQPTVAPIFSPVSSGRTTTIGDVNITHPVETLNPEVLGHQIAYHMSNAL